jgi:hypothetical protein
VVKHHRIVHLGWHPHAGAGTVLLKMNFINRPQVNGGILCQCAEFFCARLVLVLCLINAWSYYFGALFWPRATYRHTNLLGVA